MLRFPCNFSHAASGIVGVVTAADIPESSVGQVPIKDLSQDVGDVRAYRGGSIIHMGLAKVTFKYVPDYPWEDFYHLPGLGVFTLPLANPNNTNRATRSYTMELQNVASAPFEDTGSEETDEVVIDTFWMVSSKASTTPES